MKIKLALSKKRGGNSPSSQPQPPRIVVCRCCDGCTFLETGQEQKDADIINIKNCPNVRNGCQEERKAYALYFQRFRLPFPGSTYRSPIRLAWDIRFHAFAVKHEIHLYSAKLTLLSKHSFSDCLCLINSQAASSVKKGLYFLNRVRHIAYCCCSLLIF